jgi:ATP-binding cassette subfamily B protein
MKFGTTVIILFITYSLVDSLPSILYSAKDYFSKTLRLKFISFMEIEVLIKRERVDIAHYENPEFLDLYHRAFNNGFWPILWFTEKQFSFLKTVFSVILGSILAIYFNPLIYLVIFLTAIPKFVIEYKYSNTIWHIWAADSPEQRRFDNLRNYMIQRYPLVETKMLQTKNFLLNWIKNILENFNNNLIKKEKGKFKSFLLTEILSAGGFVFCSYLILQDVLTGKILLGSMIYFIGTINIIKSNFSQMLSNIGEQNGDLLYIRDLITFFKTENIVKQIENPVKLKLSTSPEIIFENVSFKYPNSKEEKYILKNLNLTFKSGQKIGLVGNNGAGKTTFIKLLCRIYDPTSGRILINGIDLRDLNLDSWWNYLSVMFQDYASYDFPVRQAIAVSRSEKPIDMDMVKKSAKMSQAEEFILKWKEQYDNQIGVEFGGIEPSKGQRQKLAIARFLYRNPLVMILDEPTASVDAESELKIFESFKDLPENMTAIFVSHDFSMIKNCDHIVVLKEGELFEEGTHNELLKNKSLYAELFNIQKKGFK